MRLDLLLDDVEVLEMRGDAATEVTAVTHDSRAVTPGALFCCVPGLRVDGHDFAAAVVEKGATALLCDRPVEVAPAVAQVQVPDVRVAMAPVAAAFHRRPSRSLTVVGITGTNGKTTTAQLVRACLEAGGRPTGVIGTMTGERTTPEATELQARLRQLADEGCAAAAIEVSSVGLAQHRVDAVDFAAAVFTNLSPDELQFHKTMERYFEAKASLFRRHRTPVAVVNGDDEWGKKLMAVTDVERVVPFSAAEAEELDVGPTSSSFTWRGERIELALPGRYNVMNALAAATTAAELGVEVGAIAAGLSSFAGIEGHGSDVDAGQPFRVVVDFAHTGEALRAVLGSVRPPADSGRVIVVFGCGGDRDPTRRQLMGEAAAEAADVVVITSDNPRTEDPLRIIDQVRAGVGDHRDVRVEPDRRAAISLALAEAGAGDVVVIAGKGHEQGQIVGDTVLPFDDRAVALDILGAGANS